MDDSTIRDRYRLPNDRSKQGGRSRDCHVRGWSIDDQLSGVAVAEDHTIAPSEARQYPKICRDTGRVGKACAVRVQRTGYLDSHRTIDLELSAIAKSDVMEAVAAVGERRNLDAANAQIAGALVIRKRPADSTVRAVRRSASRD